MPAAPPTDATTRLLLRRRDVRRRRWRKWLVAAAAVGAIAAAVYVVAFSSALAVTKVTITGAKVASQRQILDAAAVAVGTPLVQVDVAGAADRVAGLPPVATVSVTRVWPDQLRIQVTERVPRLAIPSGTGFLIADAAGVVFDTAKSRPKELAQVVADPGDQQGLADAGVVFSMLSPATADQVVEVAAQGRDAITLRLKGGARVFWGSADQSELKSKVTDALLKQPGSVYDVSAPAYPTRR